MHKRFLIFSTWAAGLAVVLGAFGAHGLRGSLDEHMMEVYKTGVHYHFLHALGLGLVAVLAKQYPHSALLSGAGWSMLAGIVVFSGSLYALSLSGLKWLGMITPLGGLAFIAAWLLLAVFAYREAE
ncbi:MAG: DUF423 domain-containing protein [Methylococcaceae bacterium]|nr:DUF423 domain-containing protein [Methylococcaceae bacterium]